MTFLFLLWGLSNCSRWSTHWWVEGGLGPKIWDLNRPSSNRSNRSNYNCNYNYNHNYTTLTTTTTTLLHYTPLRDTTLDYTTLHCTSLHYTQLHYTTSTTTTTTTLHYTTLHHINFITLRYTKLHYSPLHYRPLHYTPLHYTTFDYTTPQLQLELQLQLHLQLRYFTPANRSNRSNCGLTHRFVWDGQQTVRFQPRQFLDYDKTETDRSWDTHISRLARRMDKIFGVIFTPMYRCSWQDSIRLAGSDFGAWKKPGGPRHAWCPQKFGHVNDWVVSCSGCSSQPWSAGRARLLGGRGWIGGIRIMELTGGH